MKPYLRRALESKAHKLDEVICDQYRFKIISLEEAERRVAKFVRPLLLRAARPYRALGE